MLQREGDRAMAWAIELSHRCWAMSDSIQVTETFYAMLKPAC